MRRVSIRPENRHQAFLLALLRDMGAISRAELGDAVKLCRSKLAVELDRLTDLGLVEDGGLAASRGGRRSAIVRLSRQLRFVGIDIGATSVDVAITDARAEGPRARAARRRTSGRARMWSWRSRSSWSASCGPDGIAPEIHGAGVGVPGPVTFRDGVPVAPPIMPGWNQFPVRVGALPAPRRPVLVDNDVNIMALGEMHAGLAGTVDDLLFVKIGTGVGCGIVVDGQVYRGASGSAGDIGHIRVDDEGPRLRLRQHRLPRGALQRRGAGPRGDWRRPAAAGRSIARRPARARPARSTPPTSPTAAAAGDPVAVELVRDGGRRLGLPAGRPGRTSSTRAWSSSAARSPPVSATRCSPRSAASSTGARCRWPPATCRSSCPRWAPEAGVVGAARMISDSVFSMSDAS